jgi:glucan phosphoethanolaminetransferase (alkaline phosphatase superfamily)
MAFDTYTSFATSLVKAWQRGESRVRLALVTGVILVVIAIFIALLAESGFVYRELGETIAGVIGAIAGLIAVGVSAYQSLIDQRVREQKIETVEERLREHPERPQLAWDLARVKLENYLDRNLSQVRSIYWLTLLVMFCGFGFVMYGLYQVSQNPEKLPVSIVAAASGVIISFIGGSFLLIYRSILAQSKEYVTVLERINAVGMAVQVIASIPEANTELKSQTKAELAKQLLSLYATSPPPRPSAKPAKG